jgi:hypothetical protein
LTAAEEKKNDPIRSETAQKNRAEFATYRKLGPGTRE